MFIGIARPYCLTLPRNLLLRRRNGSHLVACTAGLGLLQDVSDFTRGLLDPREKLCQQAIIMVPGTYCRCLQNLSTGHAPWNYSSCL